jgi:hypothetical protein
MHEQRPDQRPVPGDPNVKLGPGSRRRGWSELADILLPALIADAGYAAGSRNPHSHPRPWGYWATLGWAAFAAVPSMLIPVVVMLLWPPYIRSKPVDLLKQRSIVVRLNNCMEPRPNRRAAGADRRH